MKIDIVFGLIQTVAKKEFWDRIRNRWVFVAALVFALFALVIAYFGAAQQGTVGVRGLDVTIASLVSLVIYLMPLIALILGYDAIVGERERGTLELLLSMPITRFELLMGKFLGLTAALALSTCVGFGIAGILIVYQVGSSAIFPYLSFVASAVVLGMVFLSMAIMVSVVSVDRVQSSGITIALWFFYVLVYDLLLLGILVISDGRFNLSLFPVLLYLNPADVFRILNLFGFEEIRKLYGLATVLPAKLANGYLLSTVMLLWVIAPLGIAVRRFR